jgi:prevent-host-death family protein
MEIGAFEAKNTLGALLDRVENGEEVIITRRGRPVARLAPLRAGRDVARARKAMEELRELSKGQILGDIELEDLIDEGRP